MLLTLPRHDGMMKKGKLKLKLCRSSGCMKSPQMKTTFLDLNFKY